LDKYFEETYKNTETIISEKQLFFGQLSKIEEVIVLGHSISPVDIKYFQTVYKNVSKNATWIVSYNNSHNKGKLLEILVSIGISPEKINLIKLIDLQKKL
jgi:hypothetical protein